MSERPRFRLDLIAETIEEQAGRFIDVMDPDSGNVFRFYEVEFSLACGMDGERDVAGIVKWAQDELGLTPSTNEVQTMIATLGDLGYLDRGAEARAQAAQAEPEPVRAAQQAAQVARDQDLAQGVVVGKPAASPVAPSNVELGIAGGGAKPAAGPDMPAAPDIALGAPGTGPTQTPRLPVEDVPLGQAGRAEQPAPRAAKPAVSDVSIDLAEQMPIRPDDVKEAVRASKVMQAVDVPADLLPPEKPVSRPTPPARTATPLPFEAVKPPVAEAKPPAPEVKPPVAEAKPPVAEAKPPVAEAKPPVAEVKPPAPVKPPVELKPVDKAPPPADKPPADKPPADKPTTDKPAAKPPAPANKVSPVLIVLLILVVAGAGAFFVWKFVLNKEDEGKKETTGQQAPPPKQPDPPKEAPKPPPPPPVKLAVVPGVAADVKSTNVNAGLETLEAAKAVKEGDVVARYFGAAAPTQAHKDAVTRETKARADVDAASAAVQKARDDKAPDAKIKELEDALAAKQKVLDTRTTELAKAKEEYAKVVLTAPATGEWKPVAKTGTKLAPDAVIGTVTPPTTLVATFPAAEGIAAGAARLVQLAKQPDTKLTCKVVAADTAGIKVSCPAEDPPALADAEVTLGGPADEAPPAPDAGSGSGSGSAAKPVEPKPAEPAGSAG
ncbi:MAG: hypothetical protein KF773_00895 [Deltaproteobacteria bacterium]|nr:hypothetical protein [Deltaproteobacteria bacterium]